MKKLAAMALSWLLLGLGGAGADEFPVRSIRIVVPFPAGGTTDILARSVAQALGEKLGVTTFVENRAGASGTIGSELVAKSPADGSMLLLTATHHVINPSLFRKLPYETQKDFSPIAVVATAPNALFVNRTFLPKPSPSWLRWPNRIPANCRSALPASAAPIICPARCSSRWRASTSFIFPTRAPHRP
jgi:tripartite-type tricarboxylate transporter receptor subunit TctC